MLPRWWLLPVLAAISVGVVADTEADQWWHGRWHGDQGNVVFIAVPNSMRWSEAAAHAAKIRGGTVATAAQLSSILPQYAGGGALRGDLWVPIADEANEWISVGDNDAGRLGRTHTAIAGGKPEWGEDPRTLSQRQYMAVAAPWGAPPAQTVFVLSARPMRWSDAPRIAASRHGMLATRAQVSAAMRGRSPMNGDVWVPIADDAPNQWLSIGDNDAGRFGRTHTEVAGSKPGWGEAGTHRGMVPVAPPPPQAPQSPFRHHWHRRWWHHRPQPVTMAHFHRSWLGRDLPRRVGFQVGTASRAHTGFPWNNLLSFGPYVHVPAGVPLLVTWSLSVDNNDANADDILHLEVKDASAGWHQYGAMTVRRNQWRAPGVPQDFSLGFTVPADGDALSAPHEGGGGHGGYNRLEFYTFWLGRAETTLHSVSVRELRRDSLPAAAQGYLRHYEATDAGLGHQTGRQEGAGWRSDGRSGFLSYGPYVRAGSEGGPPVGVPVPLTFTLETSSRRGDLGRHLLTLNVWDYDTQTALGDWHVRRGDFTAEGAPHRFAMAFTAPRAGSRVEYRVFFHCCADEITVRAIDVGIKPSPSPTATSSPSTTATAVSSGAARPSASSLAAGGTPPPPPAATTTAAPAASLSGTPSATPSASEPTFEEHLRSEVASRAQRMRRGMREQAQDGEKTLALVHSVVAQALMATLGGGDSSSSASGGSSGFVASAAAAAAAGGGSAGIPVAAAGSSASGRNDPVAGAASAEAVGGGVRGSSSNDGAGAAAVAVAVQALAAEDPSTKGVTKRVTTVTEERFLVVVTASPSSTPPATLSSSPTLSASASLTTATASISPGASVSSTVTATKTAAAVVPVAAAATTVLMPGSVPAAPSVAAIVAGVVLLPPVTPSPVTMQSAIPMTTAAPVSRPAGVSATATPSTSAVVRPAVIVPVAVVAAAGVSTSTSSGGTVLTAESAASVGDGGAMTNQQQPQQQWHRGGGRRGHRWRHHGWWHHGRHHMEGNWQPWWHHHRGWGSQPPPQAAQSGREPARSEPGGGGGGGGRHRLGGWGRHRFVAANATDGADGSLYGAANGEAEEGEVKAKEGEAQDKEMGSQVGGVEGAAGDQDEGTAETLGLLDETPLSSLLRTNQDEQP